MTFFAKVDKYLHLAGQRLHQVENSLQRSFNIILGEAEAKDAEVKRSAKVMQEEGGKLASKRIWVSPNLTHKSSTHFLISILES